MMADDKKLHDLIGSSLDRTRSNHECFQLLHHAFVFGESDVLLIVGTGKQFRYVVRICFSQDLMNAYGRLVKKCFDSWFNPFYANSLDNFPFKRMEEALDIQNSSRKKKDAVDIHSFLTHLKLWRCLNVNVASHISFPLPPMRMVIPFMNAMWNASKGPSDTMTKLLDSCEENLGIRSPQSVAVGRLLGLNGIAFHRCNQTVTAKDPSCYKSLDSYRDAANVRYSFQKSLIVLVRFLREELNRLQSPVQEVPPAYPSTPPRALSTRASKQVKAVTWHNKIKSNCTPKKGRPAKGNSVCHLTDEVQSVTCISLVQILQKERPNCRMCGFPTHFLCTGCKRPLCLTLGRKPDDKMNAYMKRHNIKEEDRPAKMVSLTEFNVKTQQKETKLAINTCFHIAHSNQWEYFFSSGSDTNDDDESFAGKYFKLLHEFMMKNKENKSKNENENHN